MSTWEKQHVHFSTSAKTTNDSLIQSLHHICKNTHVALIVLKISMTVIYIIKKEVFMNDWRCKVLFYQYT